MTTSDELLRFARGEIGYSRWNDPENGTKYGRWYAEYIGDSQFAGNGVPYCAMFVSYVFYHTGAQCAGLPDSYCPWILSKARSAGAVVPTYRAQPGDVVLFDWDSDSVSDHVGIVENNNGSWLTTIEGNTSGGVVARRTRAYSTVIGVVRPVYGKGGNMGWQHTNNGWWYQYEGGDHPHDKWEFIDGYWYWFDSNGYAVTGWHEIDGEWYYMCTVDDFMAPECACACNGIFWINNGYYAFDKNCKMLRSLTVDPGGKIVL